MSDPPRAEGEKAPAAAQTTDEPAGELTWEDFEGRLAASLARMAVDQYCILSTEATSDEESLYYVQFAQGGRAGFRAKRCPTGTSWGAISSAPRRRP